MKTHSRSSGLETPFEFEQRTSESPSIQTLWHTRSEHAGTFTSRAVSQCELVVARVQGHTSLVVRGPETRATLADCPEGAEFLGIQLRLGSFLPTLPSPHLVDRHAALPNATRNSFWLTDVAWPFPTFEDADLFVERLVRQGLLRFESVVEAVLQDERLESPLSTRSMQRRFLQATGLTQRTLRQIERARAAATLLDRGMSIADVIQALNFSDQPHLTKTLKHLIGQTPARLSALGEQITLYPHSSGELED